MSLKDFISGGAARTKVPPPRPKANPVKVAPAEPAAHLVNERYKPGTWPLERQELLESVWGLGNLQPGGHEDVANLMNSCALTSAKTMLDLKAGLGGADRFMVQKFGVWLVGLEQNEELVEEANKRSLQQSMDKKAIFHYCDPESLTLKPSGYDAILSRMFFSSISNKENAFEQVAQGLKPSGHMVLVDYVLGNVKGNTHLLDTMMEKECPSLMLAPARQIADGLKKNHFLVHVAEDITEKYLADAEEKWAQFRDSLKTRNMTPFQAQIILFECDRWDARAAAMKAGALKVYRFSANNSAEKKKGRVSTMSDWKY